MKKRRTFLIVAVVALLLSILALGLPKPTASAQTGDGFDLSWNVMAGGGGGGPLSGDGFTIRSTVSQLAIGPADDGGSFLVRQGYWYGLGGATPTFDIFIPIIFKSY
jgi:hypothetical protein